MLNKLTRSNIEQVANLLTQVNSASYHGRTWSEYEQPVGAEISR